MANFLFGDAQAAGIYIYIFMIHTYAYITFFQFLNMQLFVHIRKCACIDKKLNMYHVHRDEKSVRRRTLKKQPPMSLFIGMMANKVQMHESIHTCPWCMNQFVLFEKRCHLPGLVDG